MFTIYSKPNCPNCDKAKNLLKMKGLGYQELILDVGQVKEADKTYVTKEELLQKIPTAKAVPQILKDDSIIGGFMELQRLLA